MTITLFATRLKSARRNKGFTQEQLARVLNSTKATISNYETGYSEPALDVLLKLAGALDVPIGFLCGESRAEDTSCCNYKELYRMELQQQLDALDHYYTRKKDELQRKMRSLD